MTSLNLISRVCDTRKYLMAILHWKQGLLCDERCPDIYNIVYQVLFTFNIFFILFVV